MAPSAGIHTNRENTLTRRVLALLAALAFFVVACGGAPAASPLADPKEILAQSTAALANAKTVTMNGSFGGTVQAQGVGAFDLSSIKLNMALDIPNKKVHVTLDAPTLLGTNLDLIAADNAAFVKMVGPLAAFVPGLDTSGKYTKFPGTADTGSTVNEASDPAKVLEQVRTGLASLPKQPTKLADEKCGDTDCYHVQLAMSGQDLAALGAAAASSGTQLNSLNVDLWTRKNDLRPAKLAIGADATGVGQVTATFDLAYDQAVNISAPPADQTVEAPTPS